jgi:hypothetical protein
MRIVGLAIVLCARVASAATPQEEAKALVDRWLQAQNQHRFDDYAALYDSGFQGIKRVLSGDEKRYSLDEWKADRLKMFAPQKAMKVEIDNLAISVKGRRVTARFTQRFRAGNYADSGTKELELAGHPLLIQSEELLDVHRLEMPKGAGSYVPPPAASVPGYFADVMPCKIARDSLGGREQEPRDAVSCTGGLLEKKSLRELAILRNTIYARYGWGGFRKPWLKTYFGAQPWFKPNPNFSYALISDADRANAHFIALAEQSFTTSELEERRHDLLAAYGKGERHSKFTMDALTDDDKIEIGLIDRAMGEMASDSQLRTKEESSLDGILKVKSLRELSLRDLRLLRSTIYARRGMQFQSQVLQNHFQRLSWYKPDPAFSEALLTPTDKRNIALIRSVENEFGGPLNDEDWRVAPLEEMDGA